MTLVEMRARVSKCQKCGYPIAPCDCLMDGCVGAFHTELPQDKGTDEHAAVWP